MFYRRIRVLVTIVLLLSVASTANAQRRRGRHHHNDNPFSTNGLDSKPISGFLKLNEPPVDTLALKRHADSLKRKPVLDSFIVWKTFVPLSWDDFKGKVPPKPEWDATAYTGFKYNVQGTGKAISVEVTCYWNKYRSWKKNPKEVSVPLLIHEKLHFNISELYARKMRKEIATRQAADRLNQQDIEGIFRQLVVEKDLMQKQYDDETQHSRNVAKQQEWGLKIGVMMSELSQFASQ